MNPNYNGNQVYETLDEPIEVLDVRMMQQQPMMNQQPQRKKKKLLIPIIVVLVAAVVFGGRYLKKNVLNNEMEKVDEVIKYFKDNYKIEITEQKEKDDSITYTYGGENDDYKVMISTMENNSSQVASIASGKNVSVKNVKADASYIQRVRVVEKNDDLENLKGISKPFFSNYVIGKQLDKWFEMADKYGFFEFQGDNGAYWLKKEKDKTYFEFAASSVLNNQTVNVSNFQVIDKDTLELKYNKKIEVKIPEKIMEEELTEVNINYRKSIHVTVSSKAGDLTVNLVEMEAKDFSSITSQTEPYDFEGQKVLYRSYYSTDSAYEEEIWMPIDGSDFTTSYSGSKIFVNIKGKYKYKESELGRSGSAIFSKEFMEFAKNVK